MEPFEDDIEYMTIAEIEKEIGWPLQYTSTIGIAPYISRMKKDVVGVEIGTARGEGAYYLLDKCPNISKLYTIDPYKEYRDWVGIIPQEQLNRYEDIAKRNLSKFGDKVEFIKTPSSEAKSRFQDNSLDFVFIDGDHSKNEVINDLLNYYPKLKSHGIIAIHDNNINDVREAVKEFKNNTRVRIPQNNTTNGVVFWNKT